MIWLKLCYYITNEKGKSSWLLVQMCHTRSASRMWSEEKQIVSMWSKFEEHTPTTNCLHSHKILWVKQYEHEYRTTTSKGISIIFVQGGIAMHPPGVNDSDNNQRYCTLICIITQWSVKTAVSTIIIYLYVLSAYVLRICCGFAG